MASNLTILITSVGGGLSSSFINQIKSIDAEKLNINQVIIIGVDNNSDATGQHFCDRFYTVPLPSDGRYIPEILKICKHHQVDLILPCSDDEALTISEHRLQFNSSKTIVACCPHDQLVTISNKALTYKKLREHPVLEKYVPDYKTAKDVGSFVSEAQDLLQKHKSIFVKPTKARGARGTYQLSREEFDDYQLSDTCDTHPMYVKIVNLINEFGELMLMEFLHGPIIDIDIMGDAGTAVIVAARRRFKADAPNAGHIFLNDPELDLLGTIVIESFNISWLYDIDLMYDSMGEPKILEINPRPSGSIAVLQKNNVQVAENLLRLATGQVTHKSVGNLSVSRIIPHTALRIL